MTNDNAKRVIAITEEIEEIELFLSYFKRWRSLWIKTIFGGISHDYIPTKVLEKKLKKQC